ncbi:PKD domain-containing protein [Nocardioides dongxiaopingii]|uniref:PKD domain-containing protein n=1 Tax=Nocardioides dongxiaopingii TaxID=2576036 RepID=UPI001484F90A|nr:PKD domain-containing protein [Nocardioides dongxiaopingii]
MSSLLPRARRRALSGVAVLLVAAGLSLLPAGAVHADSAPADPTDPATPTTVTGDALPTAQINGVAWAQAVVGDVVYVGGDFSSVRPAGAAPGTGEVNRSNLLAYDITTGQLIADFAPRLNGQVRALTPSPDGSRLYVGGTFTTIDGQTRNRVAAFDTATRTLVASFTTNINYDVYAVAATNEKVFVGGDFQSVGTNPRGFLAAFTSGGALLDWAPTTDATVRALALNADGTKIAVGGFFKRLNGSTNPGNSLGIVDTTTGALLPTAINSVVRNGGADSAITSLVSDGDTFYGSAYSYTNRTALEGTFAASFDGGTTTWIADCHGDVYSTYLRDGALYAAGHTHYCGNIDGFPEGNPTRTWQRALAFSAAPTRTLATERLGYQNFGGQPGPELLTWFPRVNAGTYTGLAQGPWTVSGNADYVVMAGEFTTVNNKPQQGLVRFAARELAPRTQGPSVFGAAYPLNIVGTGAGRLRINWSTNEDIDNETLTYRVYRDVLTKAGLRHERSRPADFWAPDTMGFTDTGLTPGATHQYRVSVTDPDGNVAYSPWTTATVPSSGTESAYSRAVYASQPSRFWRFSETSGTAVADRAGFDPLTTSGTVTRGTTGAIAGDADKAISFNGTSGNAGTRTKISPPQQFSVETWFKTGTAGGKLVGFGSSATGASSTYDRQLYLDKSGKLAFGVNNGSVQTVTSPRVYTDNQWHHAVATLSRTAGMKLYVDGALVGERPEVRFPQTGYWGYWRVGYDNLTTAANRPTSSYFKGDLDDVAVYHRPLAAQDVADHYAAATGVNLKPVADFAMSSQTLTITADGTGSHDVDGSIASHAWDFGDGTTADTDRATHAYAAPGTYPVTLSVTDDAGATSTRTRTVTVQRANVAPTAAFAAAVTDLQAVVDAGASADTDGTLVSHAWTFGDGATGSGATATHAYATGGTYQVGLTVTDDRGATATATRQVTVAPANALPTASFTSAATDLALHLDASGSLDPDGAIASYAWTYGDGASGTGAQADHAYAAAGTYPVTLVVTDTRGGTATTTAEVTVRAPAQPFALDAFGRTTTGGWGSADVGGLWARTGNAANFAVTPGTGTIRLAAAGSGPRANLTGVASTDTEVRVRFAADKVATGNGTYSSVEARATAAGDAYLAQVRWLGDGRVTLALALRAGGFTSVLDNVVLPGPAPAPGEYLQVEVQAVGTGPTQLRAKAWPAGSAEPVGWNLTATDATAALQTQGTVALSPYLSGTSTNAPVTISYADLWAGPTR